MSTLIYDTYKRNISENGHELLADLIQLYIKKNLSLLTDGLINHVPRIGESTRSKFASVYNISKEDWKAISKTSEFTYMAKTADPLRLGLIYSYIETKNPIYITFLGILLYSVYMFKYFPKGFNKNYMIYTLEHYDDRLDFNKFKGNLLLVVGKKTESFLKLYDKEINKYKNKDILFRKFLKDYIPRYNNMIKGIRSKYDKNYKDPEVKILVQYSKTLDGKNVVVGAGIFEEVRERAMSAIQLPSTKILDMIGLGFSNIKLLKYRELFTDYLQNYSHLTSKIVSDILDEWMRRNSSNLNIKLFRTKFLKEMRVARNLQHINTSLDVLLSSIYKEMTPEKSRAINKVDARKYYYQYMLAIIYLSSNNVYSNTTISNESITDNPDHVMLEGSDRTYEV